MLTYYGVTGLPTGIFNGLSWYVGGGSGVLYYYNSKYTQQMAVNTPGTLSLKVQYNPSTHQGTISSRLYSSDQITNANLYLRYAITESHKHFHWQTQDSVQFVMRRMLPDSIGVSVSINQGETFNDSRSFYIDSTVYNGWVDHNSELVVFLQSHTDKTVLISNSIPLFQTHVSGDANGDRAVTLSDAVFLINYVFYHGPMPDPSASGDLNEDGVIDVGDLAYLIQYLFHGGSAPLRGWEID